MFGINNDAVEIEDYRLDYGAARCRLSRRVGDAKPLYVDDGINVGADSTQDERELPETSY